jgi:hypothetical protein
MRKVLFVPGIREAKKGEGRGKVEREIEEGKTDHLVKIHRIFKKREEEKKRRRKERERAERR